MHKSTLLILLLGLLSCTSDSKINLENNPVLTLKKANELAEFGFGCIDQEFPNKLGQVLESEKDLKSPKQLHPAFYGCFDWHSSVHSHFTLLNLILKFPKLEHRKEIILKLKKHFTAENIKTEVAFFDSRYNKNFERTYGWAWLLKLIETLRDSKSQLAVGFYKNLQPLEKLIAEKYIIFLDKLNYPIRIGEHSNTAFGLSLAFDYAKKYDSKLKDKIVEKAKLYYLKDKNGPISWEPGGFDFLSPCLQEASLMLKVLDKKEFEIWLDYFLPNFRKNPSKFLQIAKVSDRSDGKLAHLDGLNFSRAWCLYEMGFALKNQKMINLANAHFNFSFAKLDKGEYAGAHWLATFALYTLLKANN